MPVTPSDEERTEMADERGRTADEGDAKVRRLVDAADARDREAERRDRAAEARDPDSSDEQAAIDRIHAGRDRDAAAADRDSFMGRSRHDGRRQDSSP